MSQTKQNILDNIRRYTTERTAHPDVLGFKGIEYPDKVAQFTQISTAVGGRVVEIHEGDDLGAIIRELYPDATRFISDLTLTSITCTHPAKAGSAEQMNGTDVTIVESPLGVCENGCCWVEQRDEWRAQFFIAENLVIIIDRKDLVHNIHQAYARVKEFNPQTPFSGFISGPSKTADIEQSLVMGAHGAKGVTILLR